MKPMSDGKFTKIYKSRILKEEEENPVSPFWQKVRAAATGPKGEKPTPPASTEPKEQTPEQRQRVAGTMISRKTAKRIKNK